MSAKPTAVLTHRVFDATLAALEPHCDIIANQTGETLPREEIFHRVADADALMAFMPDLVNRALLDAAPRLRIVAGALKGCDNFDIEACTQRGIWATIVPDLLTVPTAELAIGLAIGLARHIAAGDRHVRGRYFVGWRPALYGTGLSGSTVGIIGMGRIGKALAQRLGVFDAHLLYNETSPLPADEEVALKISYSSRDALLSDSDFIFLAVPLTDETRHLIDDRSLALMKQSAFLINPCRGSVVDENAVARALIANSLGGYAADVFEFEDWALPDRPLEVPTQLRTIENRTLFTPHLGSAVASVRQAIEMSAADDILAALRGETPPGRINTPDGLAKQTRGIR